MNIVHDITFKADHPGVLSIQKNKDIIQFAVALYKGQLLPRHLTHDPAMLIVLKGSVKFKTQQEVHPLATFDVFPIPVNVEHEVEGVDTENIFLVTKCL
jgi:quercetin dioxygenase-like cupin family protein